MSTETATVLLVDTTDTVAGRLDEELDDSRSVEILVESDVDRARTRLETADIDCLILNPDPLDDTERRAFAADAETTLSQCPLVIFTEDSREDIADDLRTAQTTVVRRTDDASHWAFLAEKLWSIVGPGGDDYGEEMYRTLVESARDGRYRLDANGNLVYANESWAQMLGYERDELLGTHASQSMAAGELERGQQLIQQVLEDDNRESDIIDLEMITKEGDHVTVAVHFVVLTTKSGAYNGVMGVARDVTERRADKRELERTNERLDEFASVVSHDLRNPLSVAETRLELLRDTAGAESSDHVEAIDRSLTRMESLIDDILTLAREGDQCRETESVFLDTAAEQCWQNVETADASLHTCAGRVIRADRSRLRQLLTNLFRNAVEHGGDDVTVTVGELDAGFYVEDDGPGIPETDREKVLDGGYSTAEDGTGFGLKITREIAHAHDWDIRVTEGGDGGARFEITGVPFVEYLETGERH